MHLERDSEAPGGRSALVGMCYASLDAKLVSVHAFGSIACTCVC